MREGSYTQIQKGMSIVGRDGTALGSVDEVIADEGSNIFVGLAVRTTRNAHPTRLRGELIDRLHGGVVHVDATAADLEEYTTPEERHHEAEEAFGSLAQP